jgi:hypothetical protein
MSTNTVEHANTLVELNQRIVQMEQQGESATAFFQKLLSDRFLFRRASGKVIGKSGPEGFLDGLSIRRHRNA